MVVGREDARTEHQGFHCKTAEEHRDEEHDRGHAVVVKPYFPHEIFLINLTTSRAEGNRALAFWGASSAATACHGNAAVVERRASHLLTQTEAVVAAPPERVLVGARIDRASDEVQRSALAKAGVRVDGQLIHVLQSHRIPEVALAGDLVVGHLGSHGHALALLARVKLLPRTIQATSGKDPRARSVEDVCSWGHHGPVHLHPHLRHADIALVDGLLLVSLLQLAPAPQPPMARI
mmetsp:Transcript_107093/g.313183  ORF Transcript_107093/g.313183 Transcript_107093/m.313183 type:complete len:235 (-) Transcript_107093:1167-1871(-)